MLTRRDFMAELAVAATVASIAPAKIAAAPAPVASVDLNKPRRAVVGFHMDQPYLDVTGTAVPYFPPAGLRSGEPVAHFSEETFRRAHAYI